MTMMRRIRLAACSVWLVSISAYAQAHDTTASARLLFFGDINLGRTVGQLLLKGDTTYPFARVKDTLAGADLVFANLESVISDQHGETQSKTSNIVFCAPPVAARVLREAGIGIVSTANNHAFDYRMKGLTETIRFLRNEGIAFAGMTDDSAAGCAPVVVVRRGIRFGFLAYAQFLNFHNGWEGYVALYDSARVRRDIDSLRTACDFLIVSYHGGEEYLDRPDTHAAAQMRQIASCGADLVVGHHPHVPHGIERYGRSIIVLSLGNFVFNQPQHEWTQKSYGLSVDIVKDSLGCSVRSMRILPFRTGYQPSWTLTEKEQNDMVDRLQRSSNMTLEQTKRCISVELSKTP